MSTWPDPSATVPTTDLDDDTDNLAAARVDILDAVQKLNQILGTCTIASTPWTDLNDTTLQKRITSPTTNGVVLQNSSGDVINSGYTVETTLTGGATKLARSDAIKTYVDNNTPSGVWSYHTLFSSTTTTLGSTTTIPATCTGIRLLFSNVTVATSSNIDISLSYAGASVAYADTSWFGYEKNSSGVDSLSSDDPDLNLGGIIQPTDTVSGCIELYKRDAANTWIVNGQIAAFGDDFNSYSGYCTVGGVLSSLRVYSSTSDNFAGGTVDVFILS